MIEKVLINKLGGLIDCPVFFEVPAKDCPERFVLIEKTGSSADNHFYKSTVAVQSHDGSMQKAAELNDAVKKAMLSEVADGDYITSIELNSDYNFTDTTTKRYRYQAVFDISHYEDY